MDEQSFIDIVDYHGKKAYIYECVGCGKRTRYLRRIHTQPICWNCQQRKIKQREIERKARKMNEFEKEIVTRTLDELLSRLSDLNVFNEQVIGVIDEMKGEL